MSSAPIQDFLKMADLCLPAMMMTFSINQCIEPRSAFEGSFQGTTSTGPADQMPVVREKLRMPDALDLIARPRMTKLLRRSQAQFPATLILGRAGTGKTSIAASFSREFERPGWYSVESNDTDWGLFSRYFAACVDCTADAVSRRASRDDVPTDNEIAQFLAQMFCLSDTGPDNLPSLIVLDDIHNLFDAPWFEAFFGLLLYSLPTTTHLLLLSRSRPPGPLWRLRSKQMLNVLDEKVIAFDIAETQALFRNLGFSASDAEAAQKQAFGRVGRLVDGSSTSPLTSR